MDNETNRLLKDIANAIDEVETFLTGIADLTAFKKDIKTKRAVERNVDIIGKAMSRISKKDPAMHFSYASEFGEIRKKLSRPREETYDQTLWGLIRRRSLTATKRTVAQMLKQPRNR